jgi:hypothetical protein
MFIKGEKIIIQTEEGLNPAVALGYVQLVMCGGKISEVGGRHTYSFMAGPFDGVYWVSCVGPRKKSPNTFTFYVHKNGK